MEEMVMEFTEETAADNFLELDKILTPQTEITRYTLVKL